MKKERLANDLQIRSASHQDAILHFIWQEKSTDFDNDSVIRLDSHALAQLGVLDAKARARIIKVVLETSEMTSDAQERDDIYSQLHSKSLSAQGNLLQDSLRSALEEIVADSTDRLLTDWNNGVVSEAAAVTKRLKDMERDIKNVFELRVREAMIAKYRPLTGDELKSGKDEKKDVVPIEDKPPSRGGSSGSRPVSRGSGVSSRPSSQDGIRGGP